MVQYNSVSMFVIELTDKTITNISSINTRICCHYETPNWFLKLTKYQ